MMPEAAVGKYHAAIFINDKIRASGQTGVLNAKRKALPGLQTGEALLNRRITRGNRAHIFAAGGLIVNVDHVVPLADATPPPV